MKKVLAYVTTDDKPSLFDLIVAYDSGADVVVPYCGLDEAEVEELVHNCVFTRHPKKLGSTAIFFAGKDAVRAERLFFKAKSVIDGLPDVFSVSVGLDPEGASTTSSACVMKVKDAFEGKLSGVNATVLAGTGPVGQRVAALLAKEGAIVKLTSRSRVKAKEACSILEESYGVKVSALKASDEKGLVDAISSADVVVSCGSEGVEVLPEKVWSKCKTVRVLADVNAVPPYGIGGIKPSDNLEERGGRKFIGALAVGGLKMNLHRGLVEKLFDGNRGVYDLLGIYSP
ncbi:MAG: methylene-tetrahydromethanopterin dehydrogenase N-terminal domain-containing protein [Candidatus Altiarchaeota archaeon]